jgi:hypothetical protein
MLLLFLEQQTALVFIFWDEFIGIIDFGIIILGNQYFCKCLTFAFKRLDVNKHLIFKKEL